MAGERCLLSIINLKSFPRNFFIMRGFLFWIIDLVFPVKCVVCSKFGFDLCGACLAKLDYRPQWQNIGNMPVWSAYVYDKNVANKVMKHWKYSRNKWLFTKIVHDKFAFPDLNTDFILAVPLHRKRLIERGFNQSELLAARLSKGLKISVIKGLKRRRYTQQQAVLNAEQRKSNVQGVFVWKGGDIRGKRFVIVDDVVTTGTTLSECGRILLNNGASEVRAVCLFRRPMQ